MKGLITVAALAVAWSAAVIGGSTILGIILGTLKTEPAPPPAPGPCLTVLITADGKGIELGRICDERLRAIVTEPKTPR